MSKTETSPTAAVEPVDDLSPVESNLGKLLAVIHRVLPQLDQPNHALDVQAALRRAAAFIEAARAAHAQNMGVAAGSHAHTSVESEIVAAIAAAIAVAVGRPYKLVSVQPAFVTAPHLNAWAVEGRNQIFLSHKIR